MSSDFKTETLPRSWCRLELKGGTVLLVLEDYNSYYSIHLFHILSIKIQLHIYS